MVVLVVYVDDLIIIGSIMKEVQKTKEELRSKFKLEDLGELRYYLGILFERYGTKAVLNQEAYCERVLRKFGMNNCASVPTPMVTNIDELFGAKPKDDTERKRMKRLPYRSVVGSLMYLSCHTRPEISYSVGVLARQVSDPAMVHWTAAKRILRYLRGTTQKEIIIGDNNSEREGSSVLRAFCDSDWVGDKSDRKSTGAYWVFLNNVIVTWRSWKQNCVAASSTEAEYISLSECVREVIYLQNILSELGDDVGTVAISEDNQSCIAWTEVEGKRSKHVHVRYHIAYEAARNGEVELKYCPTSEMVADALTKPLGPQKFWHLTERMAMSN